MSQTLKRKAPNARQVAAQQGKARKVKAARRGPARRLTQR